MKKIFNNVTYLIIGLLILISIFKFQYTLITEPFIGGIFFFLIILFGLIFSIIFIFVNRKLGGRAILPIAGVVLSLFITFGGLSFGLSYKLYYLTNKSLFREIEAKIEGHPEVTEMTDLLRFSKRINSGYVSDNHEYRTQQQIQSKFGSYLEANNIDIKLVTDLRNQMEKLHFISFNKSDNNLYFIVDGMIDNEYGFIKFYRQQPEIGEILEPTGFELVNLIYLGDGWYYFSTT